MSTILLFMGKSGSGKSTLEKNLIKLYPEKFKKVVSHTTRLPRENPKKEVNGVDYHFVSKEEYKELDKKGKFVQKTQIKDVLYASSYEEYESLKDYIILTVVPKEGEKLISKLKSFGISNFKSILFNISDEKIKSNLRKDGFSDDEIDKRLKRTDLIKEFNETNLNKDIVITDNELNDDLPNWFIENL